MTVTTDREGLLDGEAVMRIENGLVPGSDIQS